MLITTLLIILIPIVAILLFMQQPQFGRTPKGSRLEKILKSPHYKNDSFQNLSPTPNLTEGVSYYEVIKEFFFEKHQRLAPVDVIPSVKTDLKNLDMGKDVLVWFGHSSYFIQIDGKRILVDPVLSGAASPLPFGTKAFPGTNHYTADDIPEIDFLFISHDHWDHLDYKTLTLLKPKVKTVICGLGVGEHLERWGYSVSKILEKDWNEAFVLDGSFFVNTVSARHFSGRTFTRNKSLWVSYVLRTPTMKIFIGGDSGYDTHFVEIGKNFGPFDLAILENGQYDIKWRYIHLLPDEIMQAAADLKAKQVLPVHSSKFVLGNHPWDEPLIKVTEKEPTAGIRVITPMIGEPVNLKDPHQQFSKWWKGVS